MFTITVVYDNLAHDPQLQTDWGFACLVEGPGETLLFDTGGKGPLLLQNMQALGVDPRQVDRVVLSHAHHDHTGGLAAFLAANPHVTVYLPSTFPAALKATVREAGATLVEVADPVTLNAWARTTAVLGEQIPEQALVLETPQGGVVITGCAHPGIAVLVRQAGEAGKPALVLGGFHLKDSSAAQIAAVVDELQALDVVRIAPGHCTGEAARRALAEAFGAHYEASGVGSIFHPGEGQP